MVILPYRKFEQFLTSWAMVISQLMRVITMVTTCYSNQKPQLQLISDFFFCTPPGNPKQKRRTLFRTVIPVLPTFARWGACFRCLSWRTFALVNIGLWGITACFCNVEHISPRPPLCQSISNSIDSKLDHRGSFYSQCRPLGWSWKTVSIVVL